jgi:16S rRNA (guanine966-N2)-methyltransferase
MFRGRRLQTLQAAVLRPTQDRVREALFSSIADMVPGAAFLDLFAGIGSVGIEAWSRGAAHICWIEANRRVFRVLQKNLQTLAREAESATLTPQCVDANVYCRSAGPTRTFDIVYADPPYARNRRDKIEVLPMLSDTGIVKEKGILVLEQGADEEAPHHKKWTLLQERHYGSSVLRYFQIKETS